MQAHGANQETGSYKVLGSSHYFELDGKDTSKLEHVRWVLLVTFIRLNITQCQELINPA